ncbi:MAG: protease SohB [Candidatus Contendobacter sp.]|mgnify:CR=1 FL=1|jgi:serine protease SohB|nr:protease SohB [Gammaproteobacteria bacterium]MCC8992457.1 protease SohB [Candidatus Contendobacter sp.]
MEFMNEYGMFLAKAATFVAAILVVAGGLVAMIGRGGEEGGSRGRLDIRHLNEDYRQITAMIKEATLSKKALKRFNKEQKAKEKEREKTERRRIFVLNFNGDIRAVAVASLREEITAVLNVVQPEDEVMVRLESAGGLVHAYGLAAAQLLRIRDRRVKLTVAVDKVAASGGYMMACVADRIIAAPFAILGSIGVIAQLPNFNRLLKKHDIDYEQFMAGEFKRTVTILGENTDQGRRKFQEEIEEAHTLFKDFVKTHRPQVDLERVATGEHWYGSQALECRLVDELRTSDDVLLDASAGADLYEIAYTTKKPWLARLLAHTSEALGTGLGHFLK